MIEVLTDFPDNVVAFSFHGHVTKADYDQVLIPAFEDKLNRHKKVRIYCEVAPDFVGVASGAVWEDTKFGFSHLFDWDRAVLVTDLGWAKRAVEFLGTLFGFLLHGQWHVFATDEADKAREWVIKPNSTT
ncbi:MAG TPA: STAS/SEC14 domain-containing protein [Mycobacterium sp.]|nr:STAS/SEC14 domain-containing protein [Mycobacterium sp.]HTX94112.1 STAS/SEC14 domain-containing protein [Mycobacterium sp.]